MTNIIFSNEEFVYFLLNFSECYLVQLNSDANHLLNGVHILILTMPNYRNPFERTVLPRSQCIAHTRHDKTDRTNILPYLLKTSNDRRAPTTAQKRAVCLLRSGGTAAALLIFNCSPPFITFVNGKILWRNRRGLVDINLRQRNWVDVFRRTEKSRIFYIGNLNSLSPGNGLGLNGGQRFWTEQDSSFDEWYAHDMLLTEA